MRCGTRILLHECRVVVCCSAASSVRNWRAAFLSSRVCRHSLACSAHALPPQRYPLAEKAERNASTMRWKRAEEWGCCTGRGSRGAALRSQGHKHIAVPNRRLHRAVLCCALAQLTTIQEEEEDREGSHQADMSWSKSATARKREEGGEHAQEVAGMSIRACEGAGSKQASVRPPRNELHTRGEGRWSNGSWKANIGGDGGGPRSSEFGLRGLKQRAL